MGLAISFFFAAALGATPPDAGESRELVLRAGRPLRVALDSRVRVKHEGQSVMATLVEPVYVFDRIVVPKGTRVIGHIERLERPKASTRFGPASPKCATAASIKVSLSGRGIRTAGVTSRSIVQNPRVPVM